MTIKDCIKWATGYLSEKKIEYPDRVAEILLESTICMDKIKFYLYPDMEIETYQMEMFKSMIKRRSIFEPIQYITGFTEFFGAKFHVNKDVFIPRPETEILVEEVIKEIRGCPLRINILDVGTGSGNIAVSLAKIVPNSLIKATDISYPALDIARYNAKINNVEDKINFLESSIKNGDSPQKLWQSPFFDIVVSNPPYIKKTEIDNLPKEVKDYEPRLALDGGNDGLDFYRVIIKRAEDYLKKDGILALECGMDQSKEIIEMIREIGFLSLNRVVEDLNGIDRVIIGSRRL